MIGPFDYHVFAHVDGRYQTAEMSPGVSASEKAALEQFFFGQTNDQEYLSSLSQEPGVIWRTRDERVLLTRVLRGTADASNRATLRFETLLLAPTQAKAVADILAGLVVSPWEKRADQIAVATIREPVSRGLHPDVISDTVMAAREGKRIVRTATQVSLRDVQKIIQSCHDVSGFSLCYKSTNERASATVNLIADAGKIASAPMSVAAEPRKRPLPQPPAQRVPGAPRAGTAVVVLLALVLILQVALFVYVGTKGGGAGRIEDAAQSVIVTRIDKRSDEAQAKLKEAFDHLETQGNQNSKNLMDKLALTAKQDLLSKQIADATGELKEQATQATNILDRSVDALKRDITSLGGDLKKQSAGFDATQGQIEAMDDKTRKDYETLGKAKKSLSTAADLLDGIGAEIEEKLDDYREARDEQRRDVIRTGLRRRINRIAKLVRDAEAAAGAAE